MIDKPEPRRFPPPWTVEETEACFIVRDAQWAGARARLFRGNQCYTVEESMREALLFVIVVAMVATGRGCSWPDCFSKTKPTSGTLSVAAG